MSKSTKYGIFGLLTVIIIVSLGAYFYLHKHSTLSAAGIVASTLEEIAQRDNDAMLAKNPDLLWDDLHPDDKERWEAKTEYAANLERLWIVMLTTATQVKEVKDVPEWTHPITGQTYTNVKEVISAYTVKNNPDPVDVSYLYQQVDGRWHFFSQVLSQSDRYRVKAHASEGPDYKELVKNPDKFKGQNVKYTGKVAQIQEDQSGQGFIRLSVTDNGYDYWSDEIYVTYTDSTDVVADDLVTVYGILTGGVTYMSMANYQITIPGMEAVSIEKSATTKKLE